MTATPPTTSWPPPTRWRSASVPGDPAAPTAVSARYAALLEAGASRAADGSVTVTLPNAGWAEWWVASLGLRHLAARFPGAKIALALPGQAPFCGYDPLG